MAITAPDQPAAPDRPDAETAHRGDRGENRPGFDLGGANVALKQKTDGAPGSPVAPQDAVPLAAEDSPAIDIEGDGGNDRAVGGPAGGTKPGEVVDGEAGAVRPPRTVSADRTFTQGNPDDAA